jgi:hypothetical protein
MARPRASATEWANRVRAWRASGATAATYAAQRGWNAGTMTWWASRVGPKRPPVAGTTPVGFVQVVDRRDAAEATCADVAGASGIEVELSCGHTIRVVPGVDVELLRTVVAALGAR